LAPAVKFSLLSRLLVTSRAHLDITTSPDRRHPQMPLGDVSIPEGWLIIAQRFNVGISAQGTVSSPEGTAEGVGIFSRPFGTYGSLCTDPNVETLGYSQPSLRDENITERHL